LCFIESFRENKYVFLDPELEMTSGLKRSRLSKQEFCVTASVYLQESSQGEKSCWYFLSIELCGRGILSVLIIFVSNSKC
jgi:hypothetical protein